MIEFGINQHGRRYCSMIDGKHCSPKCNEKSGQYKKWSTFGPENWIAICLAYDSRELESDNIGFIAFRGCQKKAAEILRKREKEVAAKKQRRLF